MRFRIKLLLAASVLVLATGVVFYSFQRYRYRFVQSDADLVRLLPPGNATLFFADVAKLRSGGFLQLLQGTKPDQEKDYGAFVRQTGFDYTRDVDALAGASTDRQLFFALRGRFDWNKIRRYVVSRGGNCPAQVCSFAASEAGRWASLRAVQPDVLGVAIGPDRSGARLFTKSREPARALPSDAPVWVELSVELLRNPERLPAALHLFTASLQPATSVVAALRPSADPAAAFEIQLKAHFPNAAAAETARTQMQLNTKLLHLELLREHQEPNPADLTGLLTSGTFEVVDQDTLGVWRVTKQLLASLR